MNKENLTKTWILTPSYVTNTHLYPSSHTPTRRPHGGSGRQRPLPPVCWSWRAELHVSGRICELESKSISSPAHLHERPTKAQRSLTPGLDKIQFLRICSVFELNSNTNRRLIWNLNRNDRKKNLLDNSTQKICDY